MYKQHSSKSNAYIWELLLISVIAIIFGYAGVVKIVNVSTFSHSISEFHLLPSFLINPVALILPVFEVLLAVALFIPVLQRPALLGVLLCCTMFIIVLISAVVRGLPVSCGCFALVENASLHSAWWALGRDVFLLGLCLPLYVIRMHKI